MFAKTALFFTSIVKVFNEMLMQLVYIKKDQNENNLT
jgi:hypothetical protein